MLEEVKKILAKRYGSPDEYDWVTEMRNDPEVLAKIKESIKAVKEGRVKSWSQIKQELGIEPKADIVRAECQERVERIRQFIEDYHMLLPREFDLKYNTHSHPNCNILRVFDEWQKQEGVE